MTDESKGDMSPGDRFVTSNKDGKTFRWKVNESGGIDKMKHKTGFAFTCDCEDCHEG